MFETSRSVLTSGTLYATNSSIEKTTAAQITTAGLTSERTTAGDRTKAGQTTTTGLTTTASDGPVVSLHLIISNRIYNLNLQDKTSVAYLSLRGELEDLVCIFLIL